MCKHDQLEFRDNGNRIICKNGECNRSWYRETKPGSFIPFMGLVHVDEWVPSTETRSNPLSVVTVPTGYKWNPGLEGK